MPARIPTINRFLTVTCLECYLCKDQENNKEKCIKTIKTCQPQEDRCLTSVRWAGSPYWQPDLSTQFYISKRCSSSVNCEKAISDADIRCHRIWFNDWECVDCCHGDKCNFYVTLSGGRILPFKLFIILLIIFLIIICSLI